MTLPVVFSLPDSPRQERLRDHFLERLRQACDAEMKRREAVMEDFLVSGAMPRDLCQVEVIAPLPLERVDLYAREYVWSMPRNEWRLT
jgi:hypothetical protein